MPWARPHFLISPGTGVGCAMSGSGSEAFGDDTDLICILEQYERHDNQPNSLETSSLCFLRLGHLLAGSFPAMSSVHPSLISCAPGRLVPVRPYAYSVHNMTPNPDPRSSGFRRPTTMEAPITSGLSDLSLAVSEFIGIFYEFDGHNRLLYSITQFGTTTDPGAKTTPPPRAVFNAIPRTVEKLMNTQEDAKFLAQAPSRQQRD